MLEQKQCCEPMCKAALCECCPQFECESCEGTFCLEHKQVVTFAGASVAACGECAMWLRFADSLPDEQVPACVECGTVRKVAESEREFGRSVVCCGKVA
jgi:hypothetical protein